MNINSVLRLTCHPEASFIQYTCGPSDLVSKNYEYFQIFSQLFPYECN